MDALLLGTSSLLGKAQHLLANTDKFNIVSVFESADGETATKELSEIRHTFDQAPDAALILAVPNHLAEGITGQLKDSGIRSVFFIPHYAYDPERESCDSADEILVKVDVRKPWLDYLEFQVCDHCNLNCKGCTHYCNISEELFADLDSYTRDLQRMKELFWGIGKIRLMGGEPLLNKELPRFIDVTREVFPDAEIRVVTNGLLIPKMGQELADAMRSRNCSFDITLYQPTATDLERIKKTLQEYEIESTITKRTITKFIKIKTLRPGNNPKKSSKHCRARRCHFLMGGRLAKCPEPILAEKLNRRFSTEFSSNDIYNIHDKNIDAWELRAQLQGPIDFCRYCVPYPDKFRWQRCNSSKAKLEDWIVPLWKVPYLNCLYIVRILTRRN